MFKSYKTFLIFLLVASLTVDQSSCVTYSVEASWIYRGNALLNNTVLTFNKDDTLNLACTATAGVASAPILFAVTKGTAQPGNINITADSYGYKMDYSNAQTIIYDDIYGIYDGYENIVVLSKNLFGAGISYDFKIYMNIGVLRPADAGTYFCTAVLPNSSPYQVVAIGNSGGVTIQVNTKPGQAHSSRANARNLITYSAVLLSASKLLL